MSRPRTDEYEDYFLHQPQPEPSDCDDEEDPSDIRDRLAEDRGDRMREEREIEYGEPEGEE